MKRMLAVFAALAVGMVLLASPASATQGTHYKHRQLAYNMMMTTWDLLSYDEQDTLCYGWRSGEEYLFYEGLAPALTGFNMSYADKKYGIHKAMDEVC